MDSEEPEDGTHKAPYSFYRTRQTDVKGNENTEGKTENKQKAKEKKLAPEPLL